MGSSTTSDADNERNIGMAQTPLQKMKQILTSAHCQHATFDFARAQKKTDRKTEILCCLFLRTTSESKI